nr:cation-translocating P-type ATPase [Deinobacterium chartae]
MVLAALGAASIGQALDGAILLFLFSLSNTLQDWAMGRTRRAIEALGRLSPQEASVRRSGHEQRVPLNELRVGDTLILKPGERVPADAEVLLGRSSLDESAITGESVPVDKAPGAHLASGTVNLEGYLEARVLRPAGESTLARLIRMVESAQAAKSPVETLADRWESPYATAVLAATPLVFAALHYLGGLPADAAWYRAMTFMVVASPCAVVISTPAVMLSAMAAAARGGVLFKSAAALEALSRVRSVAFDKTGTLTTGRMELLDLEVPGGHEEQALALAAALEGRSEHPIARAITRAASERGLSPELALEDVQALPGRGITGLLAGEAVWAGNLRLAQERGAVLGADLEAAVKRLEVRGRTVVLLGQERRIIALLGVADAPRPQAGAALEALRRAGVTRLVMLTGDRPGPALEVARQVGVQEVRAGLLPEDKLAAVRALPRPVAVVGDGVNDAPALSAADLGIGMAQGTDVALESADVVLARNDLNKLAAAWRLSRAARRTVIFNLSFAFAIIAVVGTLSVLGQVPLPLGVIAHEGGTVFVVFMGLRLLLYRV